MPETSGFSTYLAADLVPLRTVETRPAGADVALALTAHEACYGVRYDGVDDLILSIVVSSSHASVIRDVGGQRRYFRDAPGSVLVTPPDCPSYWYFEGRPLVLHLSVRPDAARHMIDSLGLSRSVRALSALSTQEIQDPLVLQLAMRLWSELSRPDPSGGRLGAAAAETILGLVARGQAAQADQGGAPRLAPWRLKQATDLMLEHLVSGVSVETIARTVDLSPDHFSRAFSASTGLTPHRWISEMRMERAKLLLRETDKSTTEIALETGYAPSHFSQRFRQIVGMSPSAWRHAFQVDQAAAL